MMRCALVLGLLVAFGGTAAANQPPPVLRSNAWHHALNAAHPALQACDRRAVVGGVYGAVRVQLDKRNRWTATSSRSLGKLGAELRRCVQKAIEATWRGRYWDTDDVMPPGTLEATERLGTPRPLLPWAVTLMPLWKRTVAKDARARVALGKLLPPDYTLTREHCLVTSWTDIQYAEYLWLPSTGTPVPRMWNDLLSRTLGHKVSAAIWDPAGAFVVVSDHGTCLVPFDAAAQAKLRTQFDAHGACWAGSFTDILLRPRVELPADQYADVRVRDGRTCGLTTSGAVTCCGPVDPPLPPAPRPVRSLALGYGFACGIDASGDATCWGNIAQPPAGRFTKLAAGFASACGLRTDGELACWGMTGAPPPPGPYLDVSLGDHDVCAVRRTGGVVCWGGSGTLSPPGKYVAVAGDRCGLRTDGTIACWQTYGHTVETPLPDAFKDVVIGGGYQVCGRHMDNTVACWGRARVSPPGTFSTLAGHRNLACGVRPDRSVACFGDLWPGASLADNAWVWPAVLGLVGGLAPGAPIVLDGSVVDERGAPVAGAEVLVCSGPQGCNAASDEAHISIDTFAQIVARTAPPQVHALVRTGIDGRWRATITFTPPGPQPMSHTPVHGREVHVVATAPGREVTERYASYHEAAKTFATPLRVRPASPIDFDATCDGRPCTGALWTRISTAETYAGTHLERLPPGSYLLKVEDNAWLGTARVDVGYTRKRQRIRIALSPRPATSSPAPSP